MGNRKSKVIESETDSSKNSTLIQEENTTKSNPHDAILAILAENKKLKSENENLKAEIEKYKKLTVRLNANSNHSCLCKLPMKIFQDEVRILKETSIDMAVILQQDNVSVGMYNSSEYNRNVQSFKNEL